jgi:hypothetical protein
MIRALQAEAEQARQDRDEMRDKLVQHEAVLYARGGPLAGSGDPPPPELVTAAAGGRANQPVQLTVAGREVLAVLGDVPADPGASWQAIVREMTEGVLAS